MNIIQLFNISYIKLMRYWKKKNRQMPANFSSVYKNKQITLVLWIFQRNVIYQVKTKQNYSKIFF